MTKHFYGIWTGSISSDGQRWGPPNAQVKMTVAEAERAADMNRNAVIIRAHRNDNGKLAYSDADSLVTHAIPPKNEDHAEFRATLRMAMAGFDAVRDRLESFSTADLQVLTETPVTLSSDTPPDANTWRAYVLTWVARHILEQREANS